MQTRLLSFELKCYTSIDMVHFLYKEFKPMKVPLTTLYLCQSMIITMFPVLIDPDIL